MWMVTNSRGPLGGNNCVHRWYFLEVLDMRQDPHYSRSYRRLKPSGVSKNDVVSCHTYVVYQHVQQ